MSTKKKAVKPASTRAAKTKTSKAKATAAAAGKQAKPAAEKAPRKLGQLDAAVKVLSEAEEPLNCKKIVEVMVAKGYWTSPGGKTPEATLASSIMREISKKGHDSRFKKVGRGLFTLSARK
jgi:hypothetical protein